MRREGDDAVVGQFAGLDAGFIGGLAEVDGVLGVDFEGKGDFVEFGRRVRQAGEIGNGRGVGIARR